jgi:hypothetical protein
MPRLEALVAARPKGLFGPGERGKWDAILAPLRKAEKAYQAERDAYLSQQLAVDSRQQDDEAEEVDADALLAQLPAEIIQQIATQTGAPADWTQWPEEFKAAVVQAILKSQQEGE